MKELRLTVLDGLKNRPAPDEEIAQLKDLLLWAHDMFNACYRGESWAQWSAAVQQAIGAEDADPASLSRVLARPGGTE